MVDLAQEQGRYTLERGELEASGATPIAIQNAIRRLVAKRRVAVPRRGFYVIVPLEYRAAGSPPASWFVDDLMRFLAQAYYVGLLSAAAIHGAAHQAPQELQVLTTTPIRPISVGRVRLRFVVKAALQETPVMSVQTDTGSMRVSTPEATALDLVRHVRVAGGLSNVATVLAELADRLEPRLLDAAIAGEAENACLQRLGYLLDRVGHPQLARPIARRISRTQPRWVRLDPGKRAAEGVKAEAWRVVVNSAIELDV